MINTLRRIGLGWIAVATIIAPAVVHARDWDAAAALYGRGVHAYFAGRSNDAEQSLSGALKINPSDPRAFYFRALSRLRLGRMEEARADMKAGAALEAEHSNRYAVGSALQRVQGSDRLVLEQFRRQARARAANNRQMGDERGQGIAARESQVLRERVVVPLDELLRPGGPRALTADELAHWATLAKPTAAAHPAAETPAPAPATSEKDPFQNAAAAPQPAAETPPSSPPPSAAPTETPAESEDDPFSEFE